MQYLKPDSHGQAYKLRRIKTVTTKLDAPYTILAIHGQASKVPIKSEMKRKDFEAHNVHLQTLMPQGPLTPFRVVKEVKWEPSCERKAVTDPDISRQEHNAAPEHKNNFEPEPISESDSFTDCSKEDTKPFQKVSHDSLPIIRVKTKGKDPGTAYQSKEGNVFMIRKHTAMNSFERLQIIERVGELTSRDQAMALHGYFHLRLPDKEPENERPQASNRLY